MINQIILDILIKRIKSSWINPKTSLPLTINDILIDEYKIEVAKIIEMDVSK